MAEAVLLKLEWGSPTGSMKDRMAVAVIEAAEARGDIEPGDTVVESAAGTTGVSLVPVCAAKGCQLHAVFSDAFSEHGLVGSRRLVRDRNTRGLGGP